MVRPLIDGVITDNSLPWLWQTPITCPRCAFVFLLTPEDTTVGTVNQIGATAQLSLGWRQLVEGDPGTAAIDTAHLHVDPAQVVGQCPHCGYNPLVQRGPRYGMAKITLNTDPTQTALQSYIAGGAQYAMFMLDTGQTLTGVFLNGNGGIYLLDATGVNAAAVRRVADGSYDAVTPFCLSVPAIRVPVDQALATDAALCDMLTRLGVTLQ